MESPYIRISSICYEICATYVQTKALEITREPYRRKSLNVPVNGEKEIETSRARSSLLSPRWPYRGDYKEQATQLHISSDYASFNCYSETCMLCIYMHGDAHN